MLIKPGVARTNLGQTIIFSELDALVPFARLVAERGVHDGRQNKRNLRLIMACTHKYRVKKGLLASVLYTRDTGHHTSGWWKNPDYERCKHLTLSFVEEPTHSNGRLPFQTTEAEKIARGFFGHDVKLTWFEPAYSEEGKVSGVGHYRLFCDSGWQPIKPRGEVYNTDWTPKDWKSFSELHGDQP